jgi:hypothetical protein
MFNCSADVFMRGRWFDDNYYSNVYPYYTYQRLLMSAKHDPQEIFPGSMFYAAAYDCFLYLHHINVGLDLKLYSKNKVHINLGDISQLPDAWNAIVPILTAKDSIVRQIKVVVPEWVESLYKENKMEQMDRDRRMSGAHIILYVYFKSVDELVVDYDAYIRCLNSIERALEATQVTPPESTFVPANDIKIGKYCSMREEIVGKTGHFLSFDPYKKASSSYVIEEFKRRMMQQSSGPFFSADLGITKKEEKTEEEKQANMESKYPR